jgi:ABC-2 type transport system permease protein
MNTATASTQVVSDLAAGASPVSGGLVLPALSLWQREMVRFFRQRNRVISAIATPLMFWLVLGLGLDKSFTAGQSSAAGGSVGYLAYFFPGTVILVLLFTAIFSTISVIEDRREGFMQGVLVSPISRLAIVMGKVLGGASIATLQGILFLAIWPMVGHMPSAAGVLLAIAAMFITAIGLTALGLCIAWPMDSTAAFHAVMNLFLMPMWFLCGAVFPVSKVPLPMQILMMANPLTYGNTALSIALMGDKSAVGAPLGLGSALLVAGLSSALMVLLAMWMVSRPRKDGGL